MTNLTSKTLHDLVWKSEENRTKLIHRIFQNCISQGKSHYWMYQDFTAHWYRKIYNEYSQIWFLGMYERIANMAFSTANVLTLAYHNHHDFELPFIDLLSENDGYRHITIENIEEGCELYAMNEPEKYARVIAYIFDGIETGEPPFYDTAVLFDELLQMIAFGEIKYRRNEK